jgi:hypothetical protein
LILLDCFLFLTNTCILFEVLWAFVWFSVKGRRVQTVNVRPYTLILSLIAVGEMHVRVSSTKKLASRWIGATKSKRS